MSLSDIFKPADDDVPELWRGSPGWERLSPETKEALKRKGLRLGSAPLKSPIGTGRTIATRFTTDYAIDWARERGWKLVDRERFDVRTKRHHDLMLGVDALFDDGAGLVGIQGAGKSERKTHWERFEKHGGVETAIRRHVRVIYLEFVRGDPCPILQEEWA